MYIGFGILEHHKIYILKAILNLTSLPKTPPDSANPQTPSLKLKQSLYLYYFWSSEQKILKMSTKWPPIGHFESDIIGTILD